MCRKVCQCRYCLLVHCSLWQLIVSMVSTLSPRSTIIIHCFFLLGVHQLIHCWWAQCILGYVSVWLQPLFVGTHNRLMSNYKLGRLVLILTSCWDQKLASETTKEEIERTIRDRVLLCWSCLQQRRRIVGIYNVVLALLLWFMRTCDLGLPRSVRSFSTKFHLSIGASNVSLGHFNIYL